MQPHRVILPALALGALVGCGSPSGPEPSGSPTPGAPLAMPTPVPGAPYSSNGVFDATVLVDAQASQTSAAEIQRVFDRAARILFEKTQQGASLTGVVYGMSRRSDPGTLALDYALTVSGNVPDGLVVLTNDRMAVSFGGYSVPIQVPFSFRNEFPSPRAAVGEASLYVAVVDFDHAYASCGYDDQGNHISDVAVGGECSNRPGTPCVQRASGRAQWTCPGVENELYADHDYFTACTFVHEFLHPFGFESNPSLDHYGSPQCTARTGMTSAQAADRREVQQNCGMCPDVYARFRRRN